jgi:Na+/proline symporter
MVEAKLRTFDNAPVYGLFSVYMCITIGLAFYGMRQRKKTEASGVDVLSAHFLGNKSFGAYVTSMNLIASLLTGYVVVGIPGDTAGGGYFTM